jgi:hypothetical protein
MGSIPDLAQACRENDELLGDLARFSEGLYTEQFVRRKYRDLLDDDDWTYLATDDLLVEMVEAEKIRRQRNGRAKTERAQQHIVRGPDVLATIMDDPQANARHRVDSIKALDALAGGESQAAPAAEERFRIVINLTADERIVIDKGIKPVAPKTIEHDDPTPPLLAMIAANKSRNGGDGEPL